MTAVMGAFKTRENCCQNSLCASEDVKSKSAWATDTIEGVAGCAQSVKDRHE